MSCKTSKIKSGEPLCHSTVIQDSRSSSWLMKVIIRSSMSIRQLVYGYTQNKVCPFLVKAVEAAHPPWEYAPRNKEERCCEIEIHNMHDISFKLRQFTIAKVLVIGQPFSPSQSGHFMYSIPWVKERKGNHKCTVLEWDKNCSYKMQLRQTFRSQMKSMLVIKTCGVILKLMDWFT